MHKVIQLIIRDGAEAQTIDAVHGGGQNATPMRVQALKGARYELQDPLNKGLGPSTIHSKRRGKDLHIGWNEQLDADLVLVDYFDVTEVGDPGAGLYGKTEDGQLNRYVFSDSANGASLTDLQETTVSVSQVLMPASPPPDFELSALPSIAVGGLNPYMLAGGVALAAAGGGGSGGSGGGGGGGGVIRPTSPNVAAVIAGELAAELKESDAALTATGTLTISDIDSPASFVAQTNTAGHNGYGKFSLTTAGAWTYVMNSAQDHFASGRSYTDSFDAIATDGTRQSITVTISGTNDAPVLTPSSLTLGTVRVNASAPTGVVGTLVSTLLTGVADLDDDALKGVAITAVSAHGKLYYSTNNGTDWTLSESVSDSHALLLGSDAQTRVYFQPTADLSDGPMDGITLRAWDRSNAGMAGGYANTTVNGGATSFSTQTNVVTLDIARFSVNPVSADNLLHLGETASISGLALPGAQISLTFPSGQVKSVTADSSGVWSLSVSASPQTARYVMLRKTSLNTDPYGIDSVWNVSDINVMSNGTNVAANQAAKLSWTSATTSDVTNGLTSDFAEVNAVGTNWIQIDLGSALPIDSVQVFARSAWENRLNGTSVYMSTTDMSAMGVDQLASASGVFRGEVTVPSTVGSSFTFDFLRMSSGLSNVSVHVVDSVGNFDRSLVLTVDDASPAPPQITLHKDTGTDFHDGITSDNQVSVSMTSSEVVRWTYSTDAGLTWQAGTGNNFLLDLGKHAADTVKVRAHDASGNFTIISNSQSYEIIEKAYISWIETDSQSELIEGFNTTDSTPVLRGVIDDSLTSSERIAVYVDGVYGGVASVNGLTWSYAPSRLSANTHTLEWRLERSVNGQWQAATAMRKHELTVAASDSPRLFNLSELEDGIEFSGKTTPLTKLKLDWAGKESAVITSDASGNWSYIYYKQESLFGRGAPAADVLNTLRLYELDVTGSTVVRTLLTHETLLDVTAPRLLSWQTNLADGVSGVAAGQSLTLAFNFSEDPADGFSLNSFSVFGGTLSQLAGTGQQRTVVFTADQVSLPTLASVYLASNSWHDAAGNPVAQDARIGLPIEVGGLAALKPITQTFHVRAGQVVALDLRDPAVNVSSSDWQVKISGLPAGMTLDHGSVANGIWTVSGADLSSLHLSTSHTDQGLLSVVVRYEHKNASGQWQAYSNVQLNGQIQPWFSIATDSDTEDFSNLTQIQQAWNLGLTGLTGHGISIGINEGSAINVNTATDFELGNVLAGSASGTTPIHAHGVGQRAAGAATSSFVGVAYDANLKWINGNATGLDVTSWSVSASAIDGVAWNVPETVTGRGGLGTVWTVAASNMGSDGNTALLRSTKSPAAMAIASIDNQTGAYVSFSAPGQAVWVAHPGWGGTSSATPAVAGEAALMLEVNPALGVRDVKSILAMSATYYKTSTPLASFEMNAANTLNGSGMHYSNDVGFGTSNVYNAVRLSKDWLRQGVAQTMANWVTTTSVVATAGAAINASTGNITTVQIQVTDDVQLEALQVINTLKTDSFSKLRIWVTSPSGTISELTRSSTVGAYDAVLEMSSNKFFGESSKGTWTVSYEFTQDVANSGLVSDLSLRLFGSANQVVDRYVYTDEFNLQLSLANNATKQSMHWLCDSDGGVDAVMGSAMQSQIQIDLGRGGYVHLMGEKVHVLAGTRIENAFGGDGNDLLIGSHDVGAILGGNAGDDTLISRGHSSLLEGGEGQDRIWLVRGDRATGDEGADRFFIKQDQFSFVNVSDLRSAITDFDVMQDTLFAIDSQGQLKTAQFALDGSFQDWQSVHDVTVLDEFSQMTWGAGAPVLKTASLDNQTLTLGFDSVMANTAIDLNALQVNGSAVTGATWNESTLTLTTGSVLTAGARLHFTDGSIRSGLGVGWHMSEVEIGTSGNDILDASSSQTNTVLMGQGGSDTVKGGSGDDYLWSTYDAGRTILTGGAGADHFALKASASNSVAGSTTVKDFSVSEGDALVLTDVLSNFSSTRVLDQWLSLSATPDNLSAKLRFDATGQGVFTDSGYSVVLENFYTHHSALATASLSDWVNSGILVA